MCKLSAAGTADELSIAQRNCLITHIDGPQPLRHGDEFRTAYSLLSRDLLRGDTNSRFPKFTHMTEFGREVLCLILGQYADALMKAEIIRIDLMASTRPVESVSIVPDHTSKKRDMLLKRIIDVVGRKQLDDQPT